MPNRLALAGAVFIAIAELLGPQRASAPAAAVTRRVEPETLTAAVSIVNERDVGVGLVLPA